MNERKKIQEAIKILGMYDRNCKISMGMAMNNTKKFLKENFLKTDKSERSDEWKIEQFNRNRASEEQVETIEEMEASVKYIFESPDGGKTIYKRRAGDYIVRELLPETSGNSQMKLNFEEDVQLELF